jgi:hypothetical protein
MSLKYLKAEPTVNVVSFVSTTRTLKLDSTQLEAIVQLWAKAEAGFTDPEIEPEYSWDGMFTGMTVTEVTDSYVDDSDTPIEGDN